MIPSIYTGRFRCRLQRMNDQGHNLVWIGAILIGLLVGFLIAGTVGALVLGFALFVIVGFATKPKAKPDADKS